MPEQVYTNILRFKEDLTRYPPHFFICVPLVLDTLYNRVLPLACFTGITELLCRCGALGGMPYVIC